jgi:hypothetical protein
VRRLWEEIEWSGAELIGMLPAPVGSVSNLLYSTLLYCGVLICMQNAGDACYALFCSIPGCHLLLLRSPVPG